MRKTMAMPAAKKIYNAAKSYVPKGSAERIGAKMGASTGFPYGEYVGKQVGKQFAKITGVGDYYMDGGSKSIMNPKTKTPRVKNSDSDVVISKCEYICDISSGPTGTPTDFDQRVFFLNPGLGEEEGGLFTFLPSLARNFSQYSFDQCVIEFRSTSGNATGANTSLGSVILCANYVPSDDPCANKLEALNSQFAVSTKTSSSAFFPIECKNKQQNLRFHQIRDGALKPNQNIDLFDYTQVEVNTIGCPTANQLLGELWITYTVRLSKYKFTKQVPVSSSLFAKFRYDGGAADWSTNPLGPSSGTALALVSTSNFTPTLNRVGKTITIPSDVVSKHFWLYCKYRGTSTLEWNTFAIACSGNTSPLVSILSTTAGQTDVVSAGTEKADTEFTVSIMIAVSAGGGGTLTFNEASCILDDVTNVEIGLIEMPEGAFVAGE